MTEDSAIPPWSVAAGGACIPLPHAGQLAAMIAWMSAWGVTYHVPLIRAAAARHLAVIHLTAHNRVPEAMLSQAAVPLVVLVGADMPPHAGPSAIPQAEALMRWAGALIVHGAAGEPAHYAEAVRAALIKRRLLMVETATARQGEWAALRERVAPKLPALFIRTRPGVVHPIEAGPAGAVLQ
ncbi:hypothetical protein GXW74_17150 [Roseomonas eburnea]|uniref:Uncharacterized protein n=1 Tax=Neoroseomonas eburnea TaxID=1346889 RepID=A0A9X9XET5_9PROT|nr:hypothetical protein [Neoroseomonas eburnea]MBR0682221.1 hypothetical protein [Neoroseomonas eburnea]